MLVTALAAPLLPLIVLTVEELGILFVQHVEGRKIKFVYLVAAREEKLVFHVEVKEKYFAHNAVEKEHILMVLVDVLKFAQVVMVKRVQVAMIVKEVELINVLIVLVVAKPHV